MPVQAGITVHDNSKHVGSAARDSAGGVAGLDGSGDIMAPGGRIYLRRSGSDDMAIVERTSGEFSFYLHRLSSNTYQAFIKVGGVWVECLHYGNKGVANGIAGLDASAEITSRLAYENVANGVPKLNSDTLVPNSLIEMFTNPCTYALGDVLLHSHDAVVSTNSNIAAKVKTIVITTLKATPSTIRLSFDWRHTDGLGGTARASIFKNGVRVGVQQDNALATFVTYSEDLSFAQGDNLQLYLHTNNAVAAEARNFRVSYLPEDIVAVFDAFGISNDKPFVGSNTTP